MRRGTKTESIGEVVDILSRMGEAYRILSSEESEAAVGRLERSFPIARWGRILWEEVPGSTCIEWGDWEQRNRVFDQLYDERDLGNPLVTVIWSNFDAPCLELPLMAVRRHAADIFDSEPDTWILCEASDWCIEVYHEGELCFGHAPARRSTGN